MNEWRKTLKKYESGCYWDDDNNNNVQKVDTLDINSFKGKRKRVNLYNDDEIVVVVVSSDSIIQQSSIRLQDFMCVWTRYT